MNATKWCWVADSQQMEARLQMVNVSQAAEALSSDSIQSPPFFIFLLNSIIRDKSEIRMKHIVESVEDMYYARQPTGEVIIDEVLNILRHYKLIYPEDVALLMDVKVRDLRSAWYMLTGTRLVDVITHWRVLQAQDWLRERIGEADTESLTKRELVKLLKETARRCGWRSETVMSHVFKRFCGISALEWLLKEQKK